MPEQKRSHFVARHWIASAWPEAHWFTRTERIDAEKSPRACLAGTFVAHAALAGVFVNVQPAQGRFDWLLLAQADWPRCGG